MINIDNLYLGLGYENHAKGQFMRLGYEAFKMEADFGFDLLITSHAKNTFKGMFNKDYSVFQVKAGRVKEWKNIEQAAGTRKYGTVNFFFSKEHLKNLLNEPHAFLLCYIVDGENHDTVVGYFWLNRDHLKYLSDEKNPKYNSKWTWFHESHNGYLVLRAEIILEAKLEEQFNNLLGRFKEIIDNKIPNWSPDYKDFNSIYNNIQRLVGKSDIRNRNSNSRIELVATTQKSGEFGSSLQIVNELLDLSKFNQSQESSPFVYTR